MIGDILVKIAQKQDLNPFELDELKRFGSRSETVNSQVGGILDATGNLPVYPIGLIYSRALTAATNSITIPIPGNYNSIWIMGNGASDWGGGTGEYLLARYNGDSGNNYAGEILYGSGGSPGASTIAAQSSTGIGILPTPTATPSSNSGMVGNFFAVISNIKSTTQYKSRISLLAVGTLAEYDYGYYTSTNPIVSITLYLANGNITAGSQITAVGVA